MIVSTVMVGFNAGEALDGSMPSENEAQDSSRTSKKKMKILKHKYAWVAEANTGKCS